MDNEPTGRRAAPCGHGTGPGGPVRARALRGPAPLLGGRAEHPQVATPADLDPLADRLDAVGREDRLPDRVGQRLQVRSEEHTSELQSRENLVCRLLLE